MLIEAPERMYGHVFAEMPMPSRGNY